MLYLLDENLDFLVLFHQGKKTIEIIQSTDIKFVVYQLTGQATGKRAFGENLGSRDGHRWIPCQLSGRSKKPLGQDDMVDNALYVG